MNKIKIKLRNGQFNGQCIEAYPSRVIDIPFLLGGQLGKVIYYRTSEKDVDGRMIYDAINPSNAPDWPPRVTTRDG